MVLISVHRTILCFLVAAAVRPDGAAALQEQSGEPFLLIDDELGAKRIEFLSIDETGLRYTDPSRAGDDERGPWPLEHVLALVREDIERIPQPASFILLSDGQRLPGTVIAGVGLSETAVPWKHPRLGRIDVPLDQVRSVVLSEVPVLPKAGQSDVIVLNNGDRLEGFITGFGDVVLVMVDEGGPSSSVEIPISRVVAATFVTPQRSPEGPRLWLDDGTILDVRDPALGGGRHIEVIPLLTGRSIGPARIQRESLLALLIHPQRVVELGALAPTTIESTVPRYVVPEPQVLDPSAPLGTNRLEYQGPIVVRYALPATARRFAAEAVLPASSRMWGDYELLIRDDDEVVHRIRMNARHPVERINVLLSGSELTIELTQGAHGPIHDRLHLERALFLLEP